MKLLLLAALALLPLCQASSGGSGMPNHNHELSGSALRELLNSHVVHTERVERPLEGMDRAVGPLSHSGVRVTLENGGEYLIHKGRDFGISSQTVVTNADNMSDRWRVVESRPASGQKTVSDYIAAGGTNYNLLSTNCHRAATDMMNQNK